MTYFKNTIYSTLQHRRRLNLVFSAHSCTIPYTEISSPRRAGWMTIESSLAWKKCRKKRDGRVPTVPLLRQNCITAGLIRQRDLRSSIRRQVITSTKLASANEHRSLFFQPVDHFFLLCEIKGVSRRVSYERQRRNWPNGKASNTVRLRIDSPVRRFVSAILLSHKTH